MAKKCSTCGTVYDGWSCPVCSVKEKLEKQKRDLEKFTKEQQRTMEESIREQERILEIQQEEMESAIEESQREMEWHLKEASRSLEQIADAMITKQKKITSESWKLQAESKIEKAKELFKAGLNDEALKLSLEGISIDPSHIYGYFIVFSSFLKFGDKQKAQDYLSKAISLLNTSEYKEDLMAYDNTILALSHINMPEKLAHTFKNIFDMNYKNWTFSGKVDAVMDSEKLPPHLKKLKEIFKTELSAKKGDLISMDSVSAAIILCRDLISLGFLEQANKLSNHLAERIINYEVTETTEIIPDGRFFHKNVSIEKKAELLYLIVYCTIQLFEKVPSSLIKESILFHTTFDITKHILKLIEDKVHEKDASDYDYIEHLLTTLVCLIEVSSRMDIKSDDLVVEKLRIVPHTKRGELFKHFKKIDISPFSSNLLRKKILERYEEWKPEIENEIRKDAREYAKRQYSKKPAVIGWIVGIGGYFVLASILGKSGIPFALFASIGGGIFAYWKIKQDIISKFENEYISFREKQEKESLNAILQWKK